MSERKMSERRADLGQRIWEIVHRSWLLKILGGALLLLYLFAILLQQMPGQLYDDPAGAQRWALITSESYGPLGNVFNALGLFNVIHNPLLQLLIIALILLVLIRLGDQIAEVWRFHQITDQLGDETPVVGEPIALPTVQATYRLRQAYATEATALTAMAVETLQERFDTVEQQRAMVSQLPATAPTLAADATADKATAQQKDVASSGDDVETEEVEEQRILALRKVSYARVRPFFFLGLLLALVTIWIILSWGWNVNPSPLVPGADYRSAAYQLALQYEVDPVTVPVERITPTEATSAETSPIDLTASMSQTLTGTTESRESVPLAGLPVLVAEIGEEQRRAPLGATMRLNRGQTLISSKAGPPALLLRTTSTEPLLSRLGQSQMVPTMGLIFPSPGSEESVVIDQALGLRIVRLATEAAETEEFVAEVYDANNQLIKRMQLKEPATIELVIEKRSVNVDVIFLPSMQIAVAHQPTIWLFWPALLFTLIGLVGYCYRPAFLLLQFAPWPIDRTVAVVQSSDEQEVTVMQQWLQARTEENRP